MRKELRSRGLVAPLLATLALALPLPACAQTTDAPDLAGARDAFRAGRYDEAIGGYRSLVRSGEAFPEAVRGLAASLAQVGRYGEALTATRSAVAERPGTVELERTFGLLLLATGDREGAERSFRSAIERGAPDALLAELDLARLIHARGEHDQAAERFDRFIDVYNSGAGLDARELAAVGTALTYLGARDPALFHDAVRAYEEAIRADPADPEIKVLLGDLFLSKYDSREAGALYNEVLAQNPAHPGALLGTARRLRFDGSYESLELAEKALETNPHLVEARAFLARLYLELEDIERAESETRAALARDPESLDAWTAAAAVAHARGDDDGFRAARDRVLALDPRHAGLFNALAEVAYRSHRYADAVSFAREAIRHDPLDWEAYALLGMNLLRVGEIAEGRATLESAFEGDPFNPWVKNTLDLLDDAARFREIESPRFRFLIEEEESELLADYAVDLAEEAFDRLAARYGYEPPTPIRVEMYARHADFSVRTLGVPGLGALGVSFGSVLAMNSPAARSRGDFNWGSTLWHEISHAFTLGYTDHRVPRWLSEGLAVLDERRAREGWGADAAPDFLVAFREGRLPELERFNYGFVRPRYPRQVQHSYFLASLLCELIEEEEGFGAVRRMLDAYRDGLDTEAVFARVFGQDLEAFDGRLAAYVERRYATALAGVAGADSGAEGPDPESFHGQLQRGAALAAAGRPDEAVPHLERAKAIFPEYAGPDAPGLLLARIHRDAGRADEAARELRAYTALNENHYEARLELADLEESLGRPAAAAAAIEGTMWIFPYEAAIHTRLADLYARTGALAGAVRERRAVLALDPVDRAEALYELALAQHRAGEAEAARRTVLSALEIAPGYEAALELLLEIRGRDPEQGPRNRVSQGTTGGAA